MPARYPLPRTWLLTDERQGDALWPALRGLRAGSGVIVRHYSLPDAERRRFHARVKAIARRRKLVILLSGNAAEARRWHADGIYAPAKGLPLGPPARDRKFRTPAKAGVQFHRCSWTPAFAGARRRSNSAHGSSATLLWAATAHDGRELRLAVRRGADLVLLSPLFPTRSHPGGKALGRAGFARLAKASRAPIIALGGVGAEHQPLLKRIGAYGWAGIDAFSKAKAKRIRT